MCVAILKPENVILTDDVIEQCYLSNPHGFGVSFIDSGSLHTWKGVWKLKRILETVKLVGNRQSLLHFRWTTHGKTNKPNCHPFYVHQNIAMAHNGILPCTPRDKAISDTHELALWLRGCNDVETGIFNSSFQKDLADWHGQGNRLAFLHADGRTVTTGSWVDYLSCRFSNLNWERIEEPISPWYYESSHLTWKRPIGFRRWEWDNCDAPSSAIPYEPTKPTVDPDVCPKCGFWITEKERFYGVCECGHVVNQTDDVHCLYCHEKGHLLQECPVLLQEER